MKLQVAYISTPRDWWRQRRREYNFGLLLGAGFTLLICAVIYALVSRNVPMSAGVMINYILMVSIAYLIYMAIANIFYGLGHTIDQLFNHHDSTKFREELFAVGYWLSVCFPGLMVLSLANFLLI